MSYSEKMFLAAIAGVLLIVGAFWWSLRGFSTTIEFQKDEIQLKVDDFFEKNGKLGGLEFSNPELLLEEEGNRVGLRSEVSLTVYGLKAAGTVTSTGKLSYRPENGTFYISELKIPEDGLTVNGVPNLMMAKVTAFVQDGLNSLTPEIPVRKLSEGNLIERSAKLTLQKVEVKPGKIVATVGN